ncbi:hypothetical protein CK203_027934 [Vitis vinifera]|uniref:Retrotransposon gag domain-containing protein n=1 Tax=Vitis vinifera TaxID=29760 RepID=A0A438J3H5_VITVI|nr:hypothetical protein CK203_027934 [Vitis vinifera]
MRDRMHPPRMSAPSCIVPPIEQLVIRPYIVPLLQTFHGMETTPRNNVWRGFMSKNPKEAMDFLSYVAEVSRGWDEPHRGEVGKMKSQPNALHAKTGIASKAMFDCQSYEHLVEECPSIPVAREMYEEQANVIGQFKPNSNASYGNTYNSSWRNHPNFSWKPRAPQRRVDFLLNLTKTQRVESPTPKPYVEEKEEEETKKKEEMKGNKKDISEEKEDRDSAVNANPEKELIKEELIEETRISSFFSSLPWEKGIKNASEILEVLRQVKVNIPLLDMIKQVPSYAKFLKDLISGMSYHFIMIGGKVVEKALLDLGANVNLLPYSIYKQLGLGELKPTSITLSLADRSFLATSNAIINCRNGLMQLTFGNMTLELNIFHMSKKLITPEEEEGPEEVCIIDTLVEEHCDQNMQDELNESLEDLEEGLSEPADVLATLQGWRRKKRSTFIR